MGVKGLLSELERLFRLRRHRAPLRFLLRLIHRVADLRPLELKRQLLQLLGHLTGAWDYDTASLEKPRRRFPLSMKEFVEQPSYLLHVPRLVLLR